MKKFHEEFDKADIGESTVELWAYADDVRLGVKGPIEFHNESIRMPVDRIFRIMEDLKLEVHDIEHAVRIGCTEREVANSKVTNKDLQRVMHDTESRYALNE